MYCTPYKSYCYSQGSCKLHTTNNYIQHLHIHSVHTNVLCSSLYPLRAMPRWKSSLTSTSCKISKIFQDSSFSKLVVRQFFVQFGLFGSRIYPFSSPCSSSAGEGLKHWRTWKCLDTHTTCMKYPHHNCLRVEVVLLSSRSILHSCS